jgi:hypothetical protein
MEVSGQLHAPVVLSLVPIGSEAGWNLEPTWTTWKGEKSCLYEDSNSDPSAVQPVASCYTNCAITCYIHLNVIVLVYTNFVFYLKRKTDSAVPQNMWLLMRIKCRDTLNI